MERSQRNRRAAAVASALTLLVAVATLQAGCRGGSQGNSNADAAQKNAAQPGATAPSANAPEDVAKLSADIERLERQAERNPADDHTRGELAKLYVRRGNAQRGAGQLREALADYQSALRFAPDNDDAQAGAAAATDAIGGGKEDENGAPAPLPITPNVADEDGKPTPTPTPKKP